MILFQRFLFVFALISSIHSFSQCTYTAAITANGPLTGCGSRVLEVSPVGDTWTPKANFGGSIRQMAVGFSIGTKGYIGAGVNNQVFLKDFWEYDPTTDTWTQKADFAGGIRQGAAGFSIGSKGYVGTGYNGSQYKSDFYEYDPSTNTWTQKANFAGAGRDRAVAFSINTKGYIGTGYGSSVYYKDFWEYDPSADTWTVKANLSGNSRAGAFGFSLNSKGYIGGGSSASGYTDFYEYTPATNAWVAMASIGSIPIIASSAFSIGNNGYVVGGIEVSGLYPSDRLWQYTPANNTWTQLNRLGSTNGLYYAVGFSIGNKGYLGTGGNYNAVSATSFSQYDPAVSILWSSGSASSTISVLSSGTYSALLTTAEGCTAAVSQSVTLSPGPTITISGSGLACSSNNNTLTASGATTYTWSANAGSSISSSVVVSSSVTEVYTVSATSGSCTVDKTFLVINTSPTLSLFTPSLIACGAATLDTKANWDSWEQKASVSTVGRINAVGFSIGTKGYIGTGSKGSTFFNDFWEYNSVNNTWNQKANFPGNARDGAIGFSIGFKGYMGMGNDGTTTRSDLWEYDPSANSWVQKASITGGRWLATAFVMGNKGYVGTGYNQSTFSYLTDFWEYNPATDTWLQKASLPGFGRTNAFSFGIGSKGYLGTGSFGSATGMDFYEYDLATNIWTQKGNYPNGPIEATRAFSIGNYGFAVGGASAWSGSASRAVFQYNPFTDTWTQKHTFPWNYSGEGRTGLSIFVIGAKAYLGLGNRHSSPIYETNDLFEYTPDMSVIWSNGSTATAITPTLSGLYTATLTNILGCTTVASQSVTVYPYPVLSTNSSSVICSGETATVSISGAGNYTWSSNSGASNSSSFSIIPSASSIYTVVGKTAICSTTAAARVIVYDTPTVAVAVSGPTAGCGTATLSVAQPGNTWLWKALFIAPNGGREYGISFSIGDKGYIGTGYNTNYGFYQDIWEYDPISNSWAQKANFGGGARRQAVGFSIGNKGYVGTGNGGGGYLNDFWEFDPVANTWIQKANVGTISRFWSTGFSVNGKGYLGLGSNVTNNVTVQLNDIWEYDPASDTWTQKGNFPSAGRDMVSNFVIGSKAYIALGRTSAGYTNEFWEYVPSTDTWTQKASYYTSGYAPAGFSIGNKGYVGGGNNGTSQLSTFYEYNPATNTWTQKSNFAGGAREFGLTFTIGSRAYMGFGYAPSGSSALHFPVDFWQYEPDVNILWSSGATSTSIPSTYAGNFTVTLTSVAGCSVSATQMINVSPNPSLAVNTPSALCAGTGQTLTASGADTYTWSSNAGGSNSGTITVIPYASEVYTLSGSTGSCTMTYTLPVSVNPLPTVSVNSGTLCAGNTFTLVPAGAPTYSFINGGTQVSPNISTSYSVNGISALGCISASPAISTISVFAYPLPTITVNSGSVCAGQNFSLNPSGASAYTYLNGGGPVVSPSSNTSYSIIGISSLGCLSNTTVVASVSVIAIPTLSASNGTICSGSSFTITPSGAISYSITGNAFVVNPASTTIYSLSGSNAEGCISNIFLSQVTVNSLPTLSVNNGTLCSGQSFVISPSGADTYTISGNTFTVNPTSTTSYSISGTSAGCISASVAVASLTVHTSPTVSVNSGSICSGSSFTLYPSGASTYTIPGNTFTVNPGSTTSYPVTGKSVEGCISVNTAIATITVNTTPTLSANSGSICTGNSFVIVPTGANSFSISGNTFTVSPSVTTTYSLQGSSTEGCLSNSVISTVSVNALPLISVNSGSICSGNNFTIIPSGADTYSITGNNFTVSPAANTSYSITGTSAEGCESTNVAISSVNVFITPTVTINSASVCAGSSVVIVPGGADTYTISGNTFTVSPLTTTSYTLYGTNNTGGCQSSAVSTITAIAPPVIFANATHTSICAGDSTTLYGSGANTYTWTNGIVNSATIAPASSNIYFVAGTNTLNGCKSISSASVSITVNALPTVIVSGNSAFICTGESATLTAGGATTYSWSTGSSQTSIIISPATSLTYTVTGKDLNNCFATAVITQSVSDCTGIEINKSSNYGIQIFPNPSTGVITALFDFEGQKDILVLNELGQLLETRRIENSSEIFDLAVYNKGIYFVKIKSGTVSRNFKIVVQ